ncbi:MAG: precorrin-4 C(11)-methyltransferase [Chloroflexota bacterium]
MGKEQEAAVYFIGAGPGAADLLTLRGQRLIQQANLILWADSLVNPEIVQQSRAGARVLGTAGMALDEIVGLMVEAARAGQLVARVHSGDPSIFGAVREQMLALGAAGVSYAVVPGVSSLFGAAAALGVELTCPEVSQTVIISRAAGRTPVPEGGQLRSLASHKATMAIFLSVGMVDEVVADLLVGGYDGDTPAAVVYHATWPDERIVRARLGELPSAIKESGISRQALILVGEALRSYTSDAGEVASRLYDPTFGHGYRAPSRDED